MARFAVQRAGTGIADQILYSGTNFGLTVAVGHYSTVREFGLFSLVLSAFLLVSAINRGLTSETLMIRHSASQDRTVVQAALRGACSTSLGLGVVLGLVLAGVGVLTSGSLAGAAYAFALASPGLLMQDTLRYCAFTRRTVNEALFNDLTALGVQVALSFVLIYTHHVGVVAFIAAWATAQHCGALLASVRLRIRPSFGTARGWLAGNRQFSLRYAADNLATQVSQQGTPYLVAGTSGLHDVAALRAAQTAFAPAAILSIGCQSALLPELVRTLQVSSTRMRTLAIRIAVGLAVVGGLWAALAVAIPAAVGRELFGDSWAIAKPLVLYFGLAQVALGFAGGAAIALRALALPALTLRARTATLVIAMIAIVTGSALAGARGVAIATAISSPVQAAVWWAYFEKGLGIHRRGAGRRRVAQAWERLIAADVLGFDEP